MQNYIHMQNALKDMNRLLILKLHEEINNKINKLYICILISVFYSLFNEINPNEKVNS